MYRRSIPVFLSLAGFLISAPPVAGARQPRSHTVGAGLQTSYVHTEPDGGNSTDQFQLNHAVSISADQSRTTSSSCSIRNTTAPRTRSACWTRWREFRISPEVQYLGRPFPAAQRSRESLRPVLRERVGRVHGRHSGWISVCLSGPRQRRHLLGRLCQESEKSRLAPSTARSATGNPEVIGAARVQIDFWDPEDGYYLNGTYYGDKNLLAIGGATQYQDGHTATTIDFLLEKKLPNGGVDFDRKRIFQLQQAGRVRPALCQEPGWIRAGELPLSETGRHRQVRDSRQVCQGGVYPGADPELQPENHRSEPQLRHQAVQRARDDVLQDNDSTG